MEKVIVYQHALNNKCYVFDSGDDIKRARKIVSDDINFYEFKKGKANFHHITKEQIDILRHKYKTLEVIDKNDYSENYYLEIGL